MSMWPCQKCNADGNTPCAYPEDCWRKPKPEPGGQPRHLVRRGLKPDGTYPLADDDEQPEPGGVAELIKRLEDFDLPDDCNAAYAVDLNNLLGDVQDALLSSQNVGAGEVVVPRELVERAIVALQRHRDGLAPMRIPVEQTDSDIVQDDLRTLLDAAILGEGKS